MSLVEQFLTDFRARIWSGSPPTGFRLEAVYPGPRPELSLEVALAYSEVKPRADVIRKLWRERRGQRATGLLLVVAYPESPGSSQHNSVIVGVQEESRAEHPLSRVSQAVNAAFQSQSRQQAHEIVNALFGDQGAIPGLSNHGLFTNHTLESWPTHHRPAFEQAQQEVANLTELGGERLLRSLGWHVDHSGVDQFLTADRDAPRDAVAVLLEGNEVFDRPANRFNVSPVEHGLALARRQRITWLLAVQDRRVRLYSADTTVGVTKGSTPNYVELDFAALSARDRAYAWLLLSPAGLASKGYAHQLLSDAQEHATDLGSRLRNRVYEDVIPELAKSVARQLNATTVQDLDRAYHVTLVILFRLLFVAYAEDRELLPYRTNSSYRSKSLKQQALAFTEAAASGRSPLKNFDRQATNYWDELTHIWQAIYEGNSDWGVPPYGGSLFQRDTEVGQAIAGLRLTNAEVGPALLHLLVDDDGQGNVGPIDFRVVSVREFGTIYEGLLESSLSIAPTDLALDKKDTYVPASEKLTVEVREGEIYFHNASGERKATGSYFTKEFAVDHLLETALMPSLSEHLAKVRDLLERGKQSSAADLFFDFSVADIAMGSGHFLIAAVDKLAAEMSAFLAENPMPSIAIELEALRAQAIKQLTSYGVSEDALPNIPERELLGRQIAKRCIYGVDINEVAVDLARLAMWIHTFVPGLPMTSLGHGLVHGNSLTGIGTFREAKELFESGVPAKYESIQGDIFDGPLEEGLYDAIDSSRQAFREAEATVESSRAAAEHHQVAAERLSRAKALMDSIVAARLGLIDISSIGIMGTDTLIAAAQEPHIVQQLAEYYPLHFPVTFPHLFNSDDSTSGFNVILGNPPWDEVMVEEPKFWQRISPGIMGLSPDAQKKRVKQLRRDRPDLVEVLKVEQAEMEKYRSLLLHGPYPGLGTGDVDYYKAFAWRFVTLCQKDGRLGVVFPRSLLNAAGSEAWRTQSLARSSFESVVILANTKHWVFDGIDSRYTSVLLTLKVADSAQFVEMAGPFHSLADFDAGVSNHGRIPVETLLSWGNGAAFPLLPDAHSAEIFTKFRKHPRFDSTAGWSFRPVAEFHATNDSAIFDSAQDGRASWPALKGASVYFWDPDFADPHAMSDVETVISALKKKRLNQARLKRSPFYGLPKEVLEASDSLPCMLPRIGFRDVTRATDTRTMIACLLPPEVVVTNKLPYLYRVTGSLRDESYTLGVLSSHILDWYSRRFVEINMNFHILNAFPIPCPDATDPFRQRVIEISGRLAAVDSRFAEWAAEVGVPVGSVTDDATKNDLIQELDAVVGHLYGLDAADMRHIFATFHRGWDYHDHLEEVLKHFEAWSNR